MLICGNRTNLVEAPIPDNLVEQAKEARERLLQSLSEVDEELGDKYLMEEEITNDGIKVCLNMAQSQPTFSNRPFTALGGNSQGNDCTKIHASVFGISVQKQGGTAAARWSH